MAQQLLKLSPFFIFLFLISLCLLQPQEQPHENISIQIPETITKGEVPFKVGQEFKYNVTGYRYKDFDRSLKERIFRLAYRLAGQPYWMALEGEKISDSERAYLVESLGKIGNRSSYKIREKINGTILKPSREQFLIENLLYYDTATGELLRAELGVDEPSPQILAGKEVEEYGIGHIPLFSSWMLDLKKNFKITKFNVTVELVGMEKIFDKNCFKVKLKGRNFEGIGWIDVDKRILVKGEHIVIDQNIRYEILLQEIKGEDGILGIDNTAI